MSDDPRLNLPSASSFHMDWHCPGRQNLLRELREQGGLAELEDPAMIELAARGQRIHQARSNGGHTLHLKDDGEVAAYKAGCFLESQLVESWVKDFGITTFAQAVLEERLWLHNPATLAPMLSGQMDIVLTAPRHALVTDWKSSSAHYVPPANSSWQLRVYAVLVWREYEGIEHVRVAYVMPERFGEKLDFCDLTLFDLQRIEQEIFQVLWRSQQPEAELRAGPHCRFCAARGSCPEAARYSMLPILHTGEVSRDGEMARAGETVAIKARNKELVQLMPLESAAAVWRKGAIIRNILDGITARLSALSDEQLSAIGLKRTQGRKLDTIRDVAGAYAWLRGRGISDTDLFSTMSFGKEKLVQLLADNWSAGTLGMSKEHAAQMWDTELDEFIERGRSKPSLVEK